MGKGSGSCDERAPIIVETPASIGQQSRLAAPTTKQTEILEVIADHEWMLDEWWEVADIVMYRTWANRRSVAILLAGLHKAGWLERDNTDDGYPTSWSLTKECRAQIDFFAPTVAVSHL